MKTNLKTFPTMAKNLSELVQKQVDWKEAFEKELREIRKSTRNLSLDEGSDVVPDLIKEILGEA